MEWIKHGDDTTRLFFVKTKQKKLASYIFTIKDEQGNEVEGFEQVGQVMLDFYKGLLGGQGHSRYPIYLEVIEQGPVLIVEQQIHMCKNFSAKDIKEAIFSIPNIKSPISDGYSNGFFQIYLAPNRPYGKYRNIGVLYNKANAKIYQCNQTGSPAKGYPPPNSLWF